MFRLLEPGASLVGVEDEMVMAGEKPGDIHEAPSPMKMVIGQECLDDGIHIKCVFWTLKSVF